MKKKIIVTVIFIFVCSSVLIGCGKKDAPVPPKPKPTALHWLIKLG